MEIIRLSQLNVDTVYEEGLKEGTSAIWEVPPGKKRGAVLYTCHV